MAREISISDKSKVSGVIRTHFRCCLLYFLLSVVVVLAWFAFSATHEYILLKRLESATEVGDLDAEIRTTKQLLERWPKRQYRMIRASQLSVLAHRQSDSGDFLAAFATQDQALGYLSDDPPTYVTYAVLLMNHQDLEEAEFMMRRAAYWQAAYNGEITESESLFYRSNGELYLRIAKLALEQGKWQAVARNLTLWHKNHPELSPDWQTSSANEKAQAARNELEVDLNEHEIEELKSAFEQLPE